MLKNFLIWLRSDKKRFYIYVPLAVIGTILLGFLWILIPFVLSIIGSIVLWKSSPLGKGWKTALAATMLLAGLTVSGTITPKTTTQNFSEGGAPIANNQNSDTQTFPAKHLPPSSQNQSDVQVLDSSSKQHDVKLVSIRTALESYKLPVKSGQWQTCVIERINGLNNLQLLTFYDWFKSLSPLASEETRITGVARKLGCPEPVVKNIPAKVELVKSWTGTGAKTLETISNPPPPWQLTGTWSMKESIGVTDAEAPYGVFLCEPDPRYETCSLLAAGFFSPRTSGSFYGVSDQYGSLKDFYLKVEPNPSDQNASWSIRLERVLEPARTIVE